MASCGHNHLRLCYRSLPSFVQPTRHCECTSEYQLRRQPREKTVSSISQTTMVNRSRMRDVGDTRQDFEELGDAIYAGTYLKEGMNREGEDFARFVP